MLHRAWPRAAAALVVAAAALALAAAPPARAQQIQRATAALERSPVYVAPGANPSITGAEARALRERIARARGGPIYIAVLPAAARDEAGGSAGGLLRAIVGRRAP